MAFRPPAPQSLLLPGPAGELQAILEEPLASTSPTTIPSDSTVNPTVGSLNAVRRFAVLCHPHPQFGGTMDNKVVHTLARTFQEIGIPTLRFNFRGVGQSQGSYADGIGETDDALAVIDWGHTRWPQAQLWLAGFSFGSFVATRASLQRSASCLITVAPPVQRFDFGALPQPGCPWLVIQGDQDELVNTAAVLAWVRELAAVLQPAPRVSLVPGAGHFFHGKLIELKGAVREAL